MSIDTNEFSFGLGFDRSKPKHRIVSCKHALARECLSTGKGFLHSDIKFMCFDSFCSFIYLVYVTISYFITYLDILFKLFDNSALLPSM